ncbi:MAG: CoA-disulfide reductase [Brevinema sp.]
MNYLIIGGNATGMSTASRLRKNKPTDNIIVIEKGGLVSFGACGLPYFVGDEFNNAEEMIARPLEAFQKIGIKVLLHHEALHLDPNEKYVQVKNIQTNEVTNFSYDKLVISTGATPIIPKLEGINLKGIYTLTKMEDGIALKEALRTAKKIVIIGAGFIGIEVAEAMRHQDKHVTIIEQKSRVVSNVFDPEMSEHLEKALQEEGIQLHLDETVQLFKGTDTIQQVITNKGTYNADLVLLSIGFAPVTQWCKKENLEMLPNGAVIIDEYCKTSIPDIYAGGDCATILNAVSQKQSYIPLATGANKLGRLLGDIIIGIEKPFQGTLGSSAIRFMDFQVGRTGLSEQEAKDLNLNYAVNIINDFNHTSYVPNRSPLHIKLIYDKNTRILLGGQICGKKDAVLRVDILAAAIFKKMTVDELGMLDLIYAPPFARTWDALNIAGNTCK